MPPVNPDDEEKRKVYTETTKLFSRWDRAERAKPPPPKKDDDDEEPPELPPPLVEAELYSRVQDDDEHIVAELQHYKTKEIMMLQEEFLRTFANEQYLKLDAAGKTPSEIADAACWLIQKDDSVPLKPVAEIVEGASDPVTLLTDPIPVNGQDPPEGTLPRTFSLWAQTDPVALTQGKVIAGLPEFAVCYANNMFIFENEDNMKAFK